MLSLQTRNRAYDGWRYFSRRWKTMRGVQGYITKALESDPTLTRDDFRITGTEGKLATTSTKVHEGDIFISKWGWDTIRVDFYQVTKVSATGKTVSVRKLATEVIDGEPLSPQGAHVIPVRDCFVGKELRNKRLKGDYDDMHTPMFMVDGYTCAHLIDSIDPDGYYVCHWD